MKHKTRLLVLGIGCMALVSLLLIGILQMMPKGTIASAAENAETQAEIEEDGETIAETVAVHDNDLEELLAKLNEGVV